MLKREYEINVRATEVFVEATPTVFIQAYLLVTCLGSLERVDFCAMLIGGEHYTDPYIFIITSLTSIISASFGMAKYLKLGICGTMKEGGSWRFLMAFLSCVCALGSRGCMVAVFVSNVSIASSDIYVQLLCCGLFIPLPLFAIWSSIGAKKSSLKVIFQHPSIILLPIFTYFTFSKMNTSCWGKRDVRLIFSPLHTWLNIIISSGCIYCFFLAGDIGPWNFGIDFVLLNIPAVVPTVIFLHYDYLFCCCCECCLQPATKMSVYDPDNQDLELVFKDGRVEEVNTDGEISDVNEAQEKEGRETMEMGQAHKYRTI